MMKSDVTEYIQALLQEYKSNTNPKIASEQEAYMKHRFSFLGLKNPLRKEIQKPFLEKANLPQKDDAFAIAKELWKQPYRECHYFAQELLAKYQKQSQEKDIELLEWMIVHNSWWDSVDMISNHLIGNYFKQYPQNIKPKIAAWLKSENIWLQRAALLFQLKYKKQTDVVLLEKVIKQLAASEEFFIKKAIGWVLREYAYTDKLWVADFLKNNELSNLSRREAMKHF